MNIWKFLKKLAWSRKDKEVKFLKIAENFKLDQKGESIFEVCVPINDNIDNKVHISNNIDNKILVRSHNKDDSGNIYEFEFLVGLKSGKVIKCIGKRVYYGPLSKRLKSKALVILISLIIGIGIKFYFDINIIFFILGVVTFQILEEIYFQIVNKKYENRINRQDKIEIIKRI